MKTWIGMAVLALATGSVWAQGNSATVGQPADLGGTIYASTFATWSVPQGNNGPLTWSYSSACNAASAGGVTFKPLTMGTPVKIVDSNTAASEVVTVTSVRPAGSGCAITVNPSNPHDTFHITTATAGLQEAINYAGGRQNVVVITPEFTRAGGVTSTITGAKGSSNVTILDERTALMTPYTWNGSAYVATVFPGGGGGGGSPTTAAAPGGAVQFNDVATPGVFAGTSNFTFDPIANALNVAGGVTTTGITVNGPGAVNGLDFPEGVPGTGTLGHEILMGDSANHTIKISSNGGAPSDVCTAGNGKCPGTAANPAGPNTSVQLNGNGTSFAGDASFTYDQPTRMMSLGGLIEQDPGSTPCWNANLGDAYCNWEHFHPFGAHTQNGAETHAGHAGFYFCSGPTAYSGFNGGAFNAFNSGGCIGNYVGGYFRGDGFKRLLDTSLGPHLNFVGMGDWSVENFEVNYANSFCCGSDEGGTPFRYQLKEFGGYLQTTLTSVTSTTTTAPDASGQGPYSSPSSTIVLNLADGNNNGVSISTGSRIADLAGVDIGCLDPAATFSAASTYYYGNACGTFTGTVAGDGTMETAFEPGAFIGKIGVAVAHGTLTPTVAYGVTTTSIGDQTNRYTNNVGVAQGVPITIHGGTAGVFSVGYACIGGQAIESVRVTAVGALSGSAQTITANVRRFHPSGAWVFSGPCRSLILHNDASTLNPYPYTLFGYVAGNLVVGVQKGGGVNFGDIFRRGSKPSAYGATWSVLNTAEIISDNALEYTPPIYQVEETGRAYVNGDKILGLPFPSRRDNMFVFRDFTTNASDQSVASGLIEQTMAGPSPSSVGAISVGYKPNVETNAVQCSATTYIPCGGWADPPNYAKEIVGLFSNIIKTSQPSKSTYGDRGDCVLCVFPGTGVDFNSTYNLATLTVNGAYGAGAMEYNSGNGDYYLASPDTSGFYQSYIGLLGFADPFNTHAKSGALSVDGSVGSTWDLGDGSARGLTNWNLALNDVTLKGVVSATSLATDSTGKIVGGSSSAVVKYASQLGCAGGVDLNTGNLANGSAASDATACINAALAAATPQSPIRYVNDVGGQAIHGLLCPAAGGCEIDVAGGGGISQLPITAWTITSNVATFSINPPSSRAAALQVGQTVSLGSFGTSTFFNGQQVRVTAATATTFSGTFTHANGNATETGEADSLYGGGFFMLPGSNQDMLHNGTVLANAPTDPGDFGAAVPARGSGFTVRGGVWNGNRGNGSNGNSTTGDPRGIPGSPFTVTGTTTSGSAAVPVSSTAGMFVGHLVQGTGIPAGTVIATIGSGTVTLTNPATATGSGVTLTITDNLWFMGLNIMNANDVLIDDVLLYNTSTYAIRCSNCGRVRVTRTSIEATLPNMPITGTNQDGIHISGPANDIFISDTYIRSGDDAVAFNAPEGACGTITNVKVVNTMFRQAQTGGRLLPGTTACPSSGIIPKVDTVGFENYSGDANFIGILFGWEAPHAASANSISNVKIANSSITAAYNYLLLDSISGAEFTNDTWTPTTQTAGGFLQTGPSTIGIDSLSIKNATIQRPSSGYTGVTLLDAVTGFNGSPGTPTITHLNVDGYKLVDIGGSYAAATVPVLNFGTSTTITALMDNSVDYTNISPANLFNPTYAARITNLPQHINNGNSQFMGAVSYVSVVPAGTDSKFWNQYAFDTGMAFNTVNDANNFADAWLTVNRSGLTPTSAYFFNGMALGWSDTALSRLAAGELGIGNGTPGDMSGTLDALKYVSREAGAAADNRRWDIVPYSSQIHFRTLNDADSVAHDYLTVNRSGATPTSIELGAPVIGPASAPSGSCSVIGWVFSQDGHATFCDGGTWITKI